MDPAHGPFVHQSAWWRSRDSIHEKAKEFEPIPNGFRMKAHEPSRNSALYKLLGVYGERITTTIDFMLPNLRYELVTCGPYWFSSRATVTPITEQECRIDYCAAWNVFRWVPFATTLFRLIARHFLNQDKRIMERQALGLRYKPPLMLLDDAVLPRDTTYYTPNDKFYVVNYSDSPFSLSRDARIDQWRLSITGAVKLPMALSYGDILQRPAIDRAVTLECIDNLPGGDSMGNAMWRGLPLKALLEEVGADKEMARDVVFRAADGYDDSIPFARAMEGDVLLAYMMNGVTLPKMHGFPLRAVVPGLYGIKNVKWITQLELYEGDYKGYWQRKGWTDDGTLKLTSRIDSPGHYQILRGKEHLVKGIAFGGPDTIKRVDISFDGGRTWKDAPFELPLSPYTWVIWYYNWAPPKAGSYQVAVRAVDVNGLVQTAEIVRPSPAGASGLHTIVTVVDRL